MKYAPNYANIILHNILNMHLHMQLSKYALSRNIILSHSKNVHILDMLKDNTALTNYVDSDGETPLSIASQYGHTKMVSLLLENKADANIVDKEGQLAQLKLGTRGSLKQLKYSFNMELSWTYMISQDAHPYT